MNETKKKTLWQRLREKYRISVLSEDTLTERWHLHLSWWGAIVLLAVLFITAFAFLRFNRHSLSFFIFTFQDQRSPTLFAHNPQRDRFSPQKPAHYRSAQRPRDYLWKII
jgi:hypothetical protein